MSCLMGGGSGGGGSEVAANRAPSAHAGVCRAVHGATVTAGRPCSALAALPGRARLHRPPAVSTGLIAGAHMGGGAYLDGCGVTLPPESEDPGRSNAFCVLQGCGG